MTSLTKKQINWLNKCTTINVIDPTWTLNPKTGLVDVDGDFRCYSQGLSDFKGVKFGVVKKHFRCENNPLTSLVGAPQEVGESFDCGSNRITSLVGAPQSVGGGFWCSNNTVPEQILVVIFTKMKGGHSFVIAAASLRNEMSKTSWKLIAPHIPEAIRPGVNMLARFGVFK